ncbi:unnamed protein product [Phytomonas sp. Hart1]|nr:unnamed protein product [Phytomonas sp. Hart1]|eukprot:CCW67198.1 unnamed protein product [Phytomonas sp. isolate Hart1]
MIISILSSIFRVLFLAGLVTALLGVKKTRFRHVPSRRTRIPRHHGETTLWLERLLNAILEMLYCSALAAEDKQPADANSMSGSPKQCSVQESHVKKDRKKHRLEDIFSFLQSLSSSAGGEGSDQSNSQVPCSHSLSDVFLPHLTGGFERGSSKTNTTDDNTAYTFKRPVELTRSQGVASPNFDFSRPQPSLFGMEYGNAAEGHPRVRSELIKQLEERVSAALEDRGIAACAEFRINALGEKLPRVKAIHILHMNESHTGTNARNAMLEKMNSSTQSISSSAAPNTVVGETGAGPNLFKAQLPQDKTFGVHRLLSSPERTGMWGGFGDSGDIHSGVVSGDPLNTLTHDSGMKGRGNQMFGSAGESEGKEEASARAARAGVRQTARSPQMHPLSPTITGSTKNGTYNSPDPTSIEVELEVEYSGGLEVSLQADLSFMRGRHLPVHVSVCNIRNLRAHMRVLLNLKFASSTMEFPGKPFIEATIWLESDPSFDMTMHTTLTPLGIKDFFLFPLITKFFLLRFFRSKMQRSRGPGVTVKVPLPSDIVDNGVERWCDDSNSGSNPNADSRSYDTTGETGSSIHRQGLSSSLDFLRNKYGGSLSPPAQQLDGY